MNKSFLTVKTQLEKHGVKNTEFLTRTKNKLVEGLDPFDRNLTQEQKSLIIQECKENIWYFFREVVRIPFHDSKKYSMFVLNLGTCAFIYCFSHKKNAWLRLPRQQFSTGTMICCDIWNELSNGVNLNLFNPRIQTSKLLESKKDEIIDLLPSYIKKMFLTTPAKNNVFMVDDAELINECEFNFIRKISNSYYFSSAIIENADPNLIKKVDNLPHFTYDMYDRRIRNKMLLITYSPEELELPEEWISSMKTCLLFNEDESIFRREILLERC